jgi:hypothetical protein
MLGWIILLVIFVVFLALWWNLRSRRLRGTR